MRIEKERKNLIEVTEDVQIGEIVLEAGDRIEVLTESALGNAADAALSSVSKLVGALEKVDHSKAKDIKRIRDSLEKAISAIQ